MLLGRATAALGDCPKQAHRQRALICLLHGDFKPAAKLLVSAQGLGWSSEDHPGHLLFPVFVSMLGGVDLPTEPARNYDDLSLFSDRDEHRLATLEVAEVIARAGTAAPIDAPTRMAIIKAMRKASEKRVAGVTEKKRRRHYGHAASLALACAQVDGSPEAAAWLVGLRSKYRRYSALQREFEQRERRI